MAENIQSFSSGLFRCRCVARALLLVAAACACGSPCGAFVFAQPPKGKPAAGTPAAKQQPAGKPGTKPGTAPAAKPGAGAPSKPAPPPPKPFYETEPFDVITLDKANDNAKVKVMPLELPGGRRMPDPKPPGKLKVRLFDDRTDEYEIYWRNIVGIVFFEDLVLQRAEQIVTRASQATKTDPASSQKLFDEAYDYYRYLLNFHPNTANLTNSLNGYLYQNAFSLALRGRIAEAMAIFEEVYQQNPDFRFGQFTIQQVLESVAGRLLKQYVDAKDYVSTRIMLERLQDDYGNRLSVTSTWRQHLEAIAEGFRSQAQAHLDAKRYQQAHDTSREMLKVWPRLKGASQLVLDIADVYPLVVVGVAQPALDFDPSSYDNYASRRVGYLMHQTLVEFIDRGPEGGQYVCPYGTVIQSDDRRQLILNMSRSESLESINGYDVSRQLMAMSLPSSKLYQPSWASLMDTVRVEDVSKVVVDLRRPHVLPQAHLQARLDIAGKPTTRYELANRTGDESRFVPLKIAADVQQRPVVVERHYADPRAAIQALLAGKVDILDRVLPNDALRMKENPDLIVQPFAFPSIHVLIPNLKNDNPFIKNRTFRRALVYGINREVILQKGLLNDQGKQIPACRVISGPFAAGMIRDDPSAYAYNAQLAPRPYDPVMATILLRLTDNQLATLADEKEEAAPVLDELVLAHPATELARFVCRQIQMQLEVIGIQTKLRELPPGATRVPDDKFDLLFAELLSREPLVDVSRIFGPGGPCESTDPYVSLALRQMESAENWKDARQYLYDLHRIAYNDVSVVPLWQMVDHFVYHRRLRGPSDQPVFFYQNIDRWRVEPDLAKE